MDDAARIAVVGSGYVGTVVASCFAWLGHDTVGVEVDRMKLEVLNGGHVPFYEPGLEELVAAGLESCRLRFTDDYAEALSRVDAVFVCVGTPRGRDGSPDMRAIEAAGRAVGMALKEPAIVVTKSTIPVGVLFASGRSSKRPFFATAVPPLFRLFTTPSSSEKEAPFATFSTQIE